MSNNPLPLSGWPKYDILIKKDYWTVREAISFLAVHYLCGKGFFKAEEIENEAKLAFNHISSMVEESIVSFDLAVKPLKCDVASDYVPNTHDLEALKVKPINFIVWAIDKKLSVPDEFKMLLPGFGVRESNQDVKAVERSTKFVAHERIIDATFKAVMYCFNQELEANLEKESIASYLSHRGYADLKDGILELICNQMPEEVRTVALPLDAKKKRHYGILAKKDEQVGMAISATVEALEYLNTLEGGAKLNQYDLYEWLTKSGYKKLTDTLLDLIWQAIPPRYKKPSKTK